MLESLAPVLGLGFVAGVMPGPLQTFLLLQTFQRGARGGLWILPAPLVSDGPIIGVCLAALSQAGPGLLRGLALAGGLFLAYLVFDNWRALERGDVDPRLTRVTEAHDGWALLARAALINGLGPGPWIFWGTVMGPLLVQQWRLSAGRGVAVLAIFYGTLIALLTLQLLLFAFARRLGPRIARAGSWLGLVLLAVFAVVLMLYGLGAVERYGI